MKTLLLIDTSQSHTSVGLVAGDNITSASGEKSRQAAQEVLPLIDKLLLESGCKLNDLDGIAVVTGPGSFTGLRIGIGAAQGLGAALELPLLPLSALALNAWAAGQAENHSHWLVAIQARDPEVYFAAYRTHRVRGCELLGQEQVGDVESLHLPNSAENTDRSQWGAVGAAWQLEPQGALLQAQFEPILISSAQWSIEDACSLAAIEFDQRAQADTLVLPNYVKEQMDYT
jgi:tRNA threonylcarbamoyladenosine biosynthesis protein TsaB